MKAKIKATGEIIELSDTVSLFDYIKHIYRDKNNVRYKESELEFIDETVKENTKIDWEQRRYDVAKKILCNSIIPLSSNFVDIEIIASKAAQAADALVRELKRIKACEDRFDNN